MLSETVMHEILDMRMELGLDIPVNLGFAKLASLFAPKSWWTNLAKVDKRYKYILKGFIQNQTKHKFISEFSMNNSCFSHGFLVPFLLFYLRQNAYILVLYYEIS